MAPPVDAASLDGRSVLVTGATGLLGSALVALVCARPCRLRLFARAAPEAMPAGQASTEVIAGDVRDVATLERALEDIDVVFHLAAQTSSIVADRDPRRDWAVNVRPVLVMLERLRHKPRRPTLVLAGSVTQAGLPPTLPLDETLPDRPLSVYDQHKLMAEQYLELYVRRGLARGTCLRLPTIYGPGPRERGVGRGLIGGAIRRGLAGETLTIYGSGEHLRDFLHVADAARALVAAATYADRLDGRHFVIGTGIGRTVAEAVDLVAHAVRDHTGRVVDVVRVAPPNNTWSALDERDVVVDASAFGAATGWAPAITLEDGVASMVPALAIEAQAHART